VASKPSTIQQQILDFYKTPGAMTSGEKHTAALEKLPSDPIALVAVMQGLIVHEYAASDFYRFAVPQKRKDESHIRSAEKMLDRILALDRRPLVVPRDVEERLVGVCHHFVVLLTAMLRAKGIAARMRYGFGAYFNPGVFEDHSICEYWNAAETRWVLLDPQFDEVWRERLKIRHDTLDVPRDRYLIGADAWAKCRAREADASQFGIFKGELRGMWFIAGVLIRDLAALNKMEMLQWDVWGAMPRPEDSISEEQLAFFDRIAALTRDPDAFFGELRSFYETDDGVRVPQTVFNAVLNRTESL
jgi:hypothetical protein